MATFRASCTARLWKGSPAGSLTYSVFHPMLNAFRASSEGVVASSTGVAYFCTELSDSPSLARNVTAALSRALSTASLPAACSCASANTSPVLQSAAFRPITYWLPSAAIEPVRMALLALRRGAAHQPQSLVHLALGNKIEKGRLLKLDRESLL